MSDTVVMRKTTYMKYKYSPKWKMCKQLFLQRITNMCCGACQVKWYSCQIIFLVLHHVNSQYNNYMKRYHVQLDMSSLGAAMIENCCFSLKLQAHSSSWVPSTLRFSGCYRLWHFHPRKSIWIMPFKASISAWVVKLKCGPLTQCALMKVQVCCCPPL